MARFSMYSGELINSSISNLDDFDSRMGVVRITKEKQPPKLPGETKVVSFSGVKELHGKYIKKKYTYTTIFSNLDNISFGNYI